jgi:hypothetical protein
MSEGAKDFVPENELESLVLEAARKSKLTQPLRQALLSTTLYALGRVKGATETGPGTEAGTRVYLYGILTGGTRMIPVFTSERRISEFISIDQPYIALSGRDLLQMVGPDTGVVVNPSSACGMEILPEEIRAILEDTVMGKGAAELHP